MTQSKQLGCLRANLPSRSRILYNDVNPSSITQANMKSITLLLPLYTAAFAAAAFHHENAQAVMQEPQLTIVEPDEYLIELSPGETRWVTENEKWELRKVCRDRSTLSLPLTW